MGKLYGTAGDFRFPDADHDGVLDRFDSALLDPTAAASRRAAVCPAVHRSYGGTRP